MSTFNFDTLREAAAKLEKLRGDGSWLLIDPAGNTYKGNPQELLRVLIAEHPLLKASALSGPF